MKKTICLILAFFIIALQLPAAASSNSAAAYYPQPVFESPTIYEPDLSNFDMSTTLYASGLINSATNSISDVSITAGLSLLINYKFDNLFIEVNFAGNQLLPNKFLNPTDMHIGGGFTYIYPLSAYIYPFAGIKGGLAISIWEDGENNSMNEGNNLNFYAQLDAGVIIDIPSTVVGFKLAASGAYINNSLRYGGTLGVVFKF